MLFHLHGLPFCESEYLSGFNGNKSLIDLKDFFQMELPQLNSTLLQTN